ncbi:MAG TPA: hypothetical protein VEC57_14890 [Candidatus Limnocylindrales bacterium]|nr:hypothetical protein [Candidatus Limnocylindrales bacterium]
MKGQKTGGRRKGTPNKATADVKAAAAKHSDEAIKTLVAIMKNPKADDRARIAAAKEILDRAHGKAPQAITGPEGGDLSMVIKKIVHVHEDGTPA